MSFVVNIRQLSKRVVWIVGGGVTGLLNSLSQCAAKEVGGTRASAQGGLGDISSQASFCYALNMDGVWCINSLRVYLQAI